MKSSNETKLSLYNSWAQLMYKCDLLSKHTFRSHFDRFQILPIEHTTDTKY